MALSPAFIGYDSHYVKSVRIRSYSGPHFPSFGLNTERYPYSVRIQENADQNNSEYGHFLSSDSRNIHLLTFFVSDQLISDQMFFY